MLINCLSVYSKSNYVLAEYLFFHIFWTNLTYLLYLFDAFIALFNIIPDKVFNVTYDIIFDDFL